MRLFANFLAGWNLWKQSQRIIELVFRSVETCWSRREEARDAQAVGEQGDGVQSCSALFKSMWRENVAVPLSLQMQKVALELRERERGGDTTMSSGLTSCMRCFTHELDYPSVSGRFEALYMQETEGYYRKVAERLASETDAAARVSFVGRTIEREAADARQRLRESCYKDFDAIFDRLFVVGNTALFLDAFLPALRSNKTDEIRRVYKLVQHAQELKEQARAPLPSTTTTTAGAAADVLVVSAQKQSFGTQLAPYQRKGVPTAFKPYAQSAAAAAAAAAQSAKTSTYTQHMRDVFVWFVQAQLREALEEDVLPAVEAADTVAEQAAHVVKVLVLFYARFSLVIRQCFDGNAEYQAAFDETFEGMLREYALIAVWASADSAKQTSPVPATLLAKHSQLVRAAPAALAAYTDKLLRRRAKPLGRKELHAQLRAVAVLLCNYHDKDMYMALYEKGLMRRILASASVGVEHEVKMVLLLARKHGLHATARAQNMLADVHASQEKSRAFREHARKTMAGAQVPLDVLLLGPSWPVHASQQAGDDAAIPREVGVWHTMFMNHHGAGEKQLECVHHLEQAEVTYNITDSRAVPLLVTAFQLALLAVFTRAKTSATVAELQQATKLPLDVVRAHLRPLLVAGLLVTPDLQLPPTAAVSLNPSFAAPAGVARVSLLPNTAQDDARLAALAARTGSVASFVQPSGAAAGAAGVDAETAEVVEKERQQLLQAVAMRMLKKARSMKFAALAAQCAAEPVVTSRFKPGEQDIKKALLVLDQNGFVKYNRQEGTVAYIP